MNTNPITRGELLLALAMFRKLSPENRELALALVETLRESQEVSDGSTVSTPRTP